MSREQNLNDWGTTSGLLDDFDFQIREAWFGKDARFGDGKVALLNLRGEAIQEGEVVDEEHLALYGCGDGWEIEKGGEAVRHPSGKTKFSDQSNLGRLVNTVVDFGDEVLQVLAERGKPTDAETWRGISFHMERKAFSFKDRRTGEVRDYEVLLPTEFLGVLEEEEEAAPAKKTAAKATAKATARPTAKATAKPKPKAKPEDNGFRGEVVAFAQQFEADDHASFVDQVFDAEVVGEEFKDALDADEELTAEALDSDSALWAEAHS